MFKSKWGRRFIMTQKQKALVQNSFEKVRPIAGAAADLFYDRFFTVDPSLRVLFGDDLKQQSRKVMHMIGVLVKGLDNMQQLMPLIEELGRRHAMYGIKNNHYDTFGDSLLWTLERAL